MSLINKIKKNSTLKHTSVLSESILFNEKDMIPTNVPVLNVALSGQLDGGFIPSVTIWAGESKRFKSLFSLLMVKAYLNKYPDAIVIFYDSEFGTPKAYFESLNLPKDQILHCPITNVEQLKFDLVKQLDLIERGDKVIVVVDSLGNLASKKEVEDALDEKSTQDMSRAKMIKSVFRIITPILTLKDIPLIVVNHVYKEQGCFSGDVKIKTENGLTMIKDIKVGDKVYALSGIQTVTATYSPKDLDTTGKKFIEIEFDDGSTVKCTDNHRFYTKNGEWVEAIDLKVGEEMY